jgi:hypothetical protein
LPSSLCTCIERMDNKAQPKVMIFIKTPRF